MLSHRPRPEAVEIGAATLGVPDVEAIAVGLVPVSLASAARSRMAESFAFVRDLAAHDVPVYGLTTGCGPLAGHRVSADVREQFQRNLARSHAASLGPRHPATFVRAAMAVRAHTLAHGGSGVDPALVELLIGLLEARIHPVVRELGGVGASGDLVELAHVALTTLGEGVVEHEGHDLPAAEALEFAGLVPIVPRHREVLATMNGTSFHTGVAALLVARAQRVLDSAIAAAALHFEALAGHAETLAAALHAARPHAGQAAIAERLRACTAGSRLVRHDQPAASSQDPYSIRCIPQILGPAAATVSRVQAVVETEIASITDNPLFLPADGRVLHGGNFHGQPVAAALDDLKSALVEVGVASERRVARVLDVKRSQGLPAFLVRGEPGVTSGFMGLQYAASTMAAENGSLAGAASVRSVPTNADNQDVVPMAMLAARQASRVLENVERLVAIEMLCGAQAIELRGLELASPAARALVARVREHSPTLDHDRPLASDVNAIVRMNGGDAPEAPPRALAAIAAG